jgi:murein L,D-transpeptidase YafK
MKRHGMSCLLTLVFALCAHAEGTASAPALADRVVIRKAERLLLLERNGRILREYPVSLGQNPFGHKQRRGDKRTPEGSYVVTQRRSESRFYKALLISYPNRNDIKTALEKGYDPGGMIMIHGMPEAARGDEEDYIQRDWTDGCIAVTNEAIDQIWSLVRDGTPVDILP